MLSTRGPPSCSCNGSGSTTSGATSDSLIWGRNPNLGSTPELCRGLPGRRCRFRGYAICVAGLGAPVGACGGWGELASAARRGNTRLAVPCPVRFACLGAMVGLDGDDVPGTSARMVLADFSLACRFQAHVPGIRLCRGRGVDSGLDPAPAQVEGMGNPPRAQLDGGTHTGLGSALDAVAAMDRHRKKLPRDVRLHAARPARGSWLPRQPESR